MGAVPLAPAAASSLEVTTDFVSEYVFRGVDYHQGTSLQTSLNYNILNSLTAAIWTNLRMENGFALTETDYSLQWRAITAGRAQATFGTLLYDRAASLGGQTGELFAGVDINMPVKPSLYVYYDWHANPGAYFEGSLSHRFQLPNYKGSVDLSGTLGFDAGRINGYQNAKIAVGFTRFLGDWRLSPAVEVNFPARDVDPLANNCRPVFKFTASRSF
jgi:hypothetical protein